MRDLGRDAFTVLEDDTPQSITAFAASEFPASVALAVDRSVSMQGTALTMARTAGRVFLSSLRPDDRVALIAIGSEVETLAPMSQDRTAALDALARLDAWGVTLLNDAILRSVDLLGNERGRRAVVLLSDGEDRFSRASDADVVAHVRASDVMLYPIAIGPRRSQLFAEIAALSGGRSFHLRNARELQPTLKAVADDLRWQYLLGYTPSRPLPSGEPQWRSITVKVNRPGVRVRARAGYLAGQ